MFYETPYQLSFFFFQAEDGIRDIGVTGVQTCALPISLLLALQLLGHLPVALGLGAQVVDHGVEEVLRKLGVELLSRDGASRNRPVRSRKGLGKLLPRLVHPLHPSLIHHTHTLLSCLPVRCTLQQALHTNALEQVPPASYYIVAKYGHSRRAHQYLGGLHIKA